MGDGFQGHNQANNFAAGLAMQGSLAGPKRWKAPDCSTLPIASKLVDQLWEVDRDPVWVQDVAEFFGPTTQSNVLGKKYTVLSHGGIKAEGEPAPGPKIWNEAEAWSMFRKEFMAYCDGAKQIAYRRWPMAEQMQEGNWLITCRLYVWRGE